MRLPENRLLDSQSFSLPFSLSLVGREREVMTRMETEEADDANQSVSEGGGTAGAQACICTEIRDDGARAQQHHGIYLSTH